MEPPIDPDQLSPLIGQIYDCVIDPSRWQATIDSLRQSLGFATAALSLATLAEGKVLLMITSGIAPEAGARLAALWEHVVDLWGGPQRVFDYPLAEPIQLSQAVNIQQANRNPLFTTWAQPQGLVDMVAIGLTRDAEAVGSLGMGWHPAGGALGERQLALLRLLAPHLRRAVTITRLMEVQLLAATTFARALDALRWAVVLVDETLGIVHANAPAEALLGAGREVRSDAGRLRLAPPRSQATLVDAAARLAAPNGAPARALGQRGIGIPIERAGGAPPLVAHLLPLQAGELRAGLSQRARGAVFITDAQAAAPAPTAALALLYDLTPGETRVFELIAGGSTPTQVANRLGLAPSTVKTHLLHVFDKTGCSRQSELVRLAASLAL